MAMYGVTRMIKIPGFNSGRNSLSAISKQINTKLTRGIIRSVSTKTFEKMLVYELGNSALHDTFTATINIINYYIKQYRNKKSVGGEFFWNAA